MVEIIPAILTDSSVKFKDLILRTEPYTKRIHIDVADGEFVPNKTITGYDELKLIESAAKFDVHLMVKNPEGHLKEWLYTHADRFILHVESEGDIGKLIEDLHSDHRKVGLALNPETDPAKIKPFIGKIDFVQFMTVHPGNYGGEFVERVVGKMLDFHGRYPNVPIMVDGAIHTETARMVIAVGASTLVVGTHILNEGNDVGKAIEELNKISNNI